MRSSHVLKRLTGNVKVATVLGFDPSLLRHSGLWEAADSAVLNKVHEKAYTAGQIKASPNSQGSNLTLRMFGNNFIEEITFGLDPPTVPGSLLLLLPISWEPATPSEPYLAYRKKRKLENCISVFWDKQRVIRNLMDAKIDRRQQLHGVVKYAVLSENLKLFQ